MNTRTTLPFFALFISSITLYSQGLYSFLGPSYLLPKKYKFTPNQPHPEYFPTPYFDYFAKRGPINNNRLLPEQSESFLHKLNLYKSFFKDADLHLSSFHCLFLDYTRGYCEETLFHSIQSFYNDLYDNYDQLSSSIQSKNLNLTFDEIIPIALLDCFTNKQRETLIKLSYENYFQEWLDSSNNRELTTDYSKLLIRYHFLLKSLSYVPEEYLHNIILHSRCETEVKLAESIINYLLPTNFKSFAYSRNNGIGFKNFRYFEYIHLKVNTNYTLDNFPTICHLLPYINLIHQDYPHLTKSAQDNIDIIFEIDKIIQDKPIILKRLIDRYKLDHRARYQLARYIISSNYHTKEEILELLNILKEQYLNTKVFEKGNTKYASYKYVFFYFAAFSHLVTSYTYDMNISNQ